MDAGRILWKSVEDALDSLGKSAKQTMLWQLSRRGFQAAPDNFDINRFALALSDLLGEGSETVLDLVYRNLCRNLEAEQSADPGLPALDSINKILEAKKMN
jgi:hypothetical protein